MGDSTKTQKCYDDILNAIKFYGLDQKSIGNIEGAKAELSRIGAWLLQNPGCSKDDIIVMLTAEAQRIKDITEEA